MASNNSTQKHSLEAVTREEALPKLNTQNQACQTRETEVEMVGVCLSLATDIITIREEFQVTEVK